MYVSVTVINFIFESFTYEVTFFQKKSELFNYAATVFVARINAAQVFCGRVHHVIMNATVNMSVHQHNVQMHACSCGGVPLVTALRQQPRMDCHHGHKEDRKFWEWCSGVQNVGQLTLWEMSLDKCTPNLKHEQLWWKCVGRTAGHELLQ